MKGLLQAYSIYFFQKILDLWHKIDTINSEGENGCGSS